MIGFNGEWIPADRPIYYGNKKAEKLKYPGDSEPHSFVYERNGTRFIMTLGGEERGLARGTEFRKVNSGSTVLQKVWAEADQRMILSTIVAELPENVRAPHIRVFHQLEKKLSQAGPKL